MTNYTFEEKKALMEEQMSKSWAEIDAIFMKHSGHRTFTEKVYADDWVSAKWPLFELFGQKLKLTKTVENTLNNEEVRNSLISVVVRPLERMSEANERDLTALKVLFSNLTLDEFKTNRISENKAVLGEKLQKGSKLSKSLKLFIKDKKYLEKAQILFSQTNEAMLARGELQASIDPIDIIMMSKNETRDWNSCHNIFEGCYGAGPLSYLLDSSTFIAQIVFGKQKDIPDKIWRRMCMIDTTMSSILVSKSYPSSNSNNTNALKDLFIETFGEENVATGLIDREDIEGQVEDMGDIHYNDITHQAMSKVPMIVLNKQKYKIDAKNDTETTLRNPLKEGAFSDLEFLVGVKELTSPTMDFNIYDSIEDGGVFSDDCDGYDDEDDDDDWDLD